VGAVQQRERASKRERDCSWDSSVSQRQRERLDRTCARTQLKSARTVGVCVCAVHVCMCVYARACVLSCNDVGTLVRARLCAHCVCGQHALPHHHHQPRHHEDH
ncbi:hypothetical protein MHYP_G00315860, partial [Metynnis hypsauchen]